MECAIVQWLACYRLPIEGVGSSNPRQGRTVIYVDISATPKLNFGFIFVFNFDFNFVYNIISDGISDLNKH